MSSSIDTQRERQSALLAKQVRLPIIFFSIGYIFFRAALYLPFHEWMPDTLISLTVSPHLFGFQPEPAVTALYALGLVGIWIGYLGGRPIGRKLIPSVETIEQSDRQLRKIWPFLVGIPALAFVAQIAILGTLPLINVAVRWQLNAKLVAVIMLLIAVCGSAVAVWGWSKRTLVTLTLSFVALASLGARTIPLVLVMAVLIVVTLYGTRRTAARIAGVGAAGVITVMIAVGASTKTQIYGSSSDGIDIKKGLALFQTDSIGTFYNLNEVYLSLKDSATGTNGRMLLDTILNMVPGIQRDYANFQLGKLVAGRETVTIAGQELDRSVSLTATIVGAPFADAGWFGVFLIAIGIGLFWSIAEDFAIAWRWFAGFYAYWLGEIFASIYGGPYNHVVIMSGGAIVLVIALRLLTLSSPSRKKIAKQRSV